MTSPRRKPGESDEAFTERYVEEEGLPDSWKLLGPPCPDDGEDPFGDASARTIQLRSDAARGDIVIPLARPQNRMRQHRPRRHCVAHCSMR